MKKYKVGYFIKDGGQKMFSSLERFEKWIFTRKISKKLLLSVFITVFILSLVPIIATSFYTIPAADDYNFGLQSHLSWINGEGFMRGVFESCQSFYNNWQGFYTSNFWASVQPFNIDIRLYFISNIVIILGLIFSLFYFSKTILMNVMKMTVVDYLLISIPFVEIIIQFMPSAAEGFYWMDGSLSIWINSVVLLIISFVINFSVATSKKARYIYSFLAILSVISISGSSLLCYVTLMCVLAVLTICFVKKSKPTCILMIIIMCIYTLGIIIALLAPGNANRMEQMSGYSFGYSILLAIFFGFIRMGTWATLSVLAFLVFSAIIFYSYAIDSSYEFRHPLMVTILCFGLYSARMSVQLFCAGYLGAPRQINQYFLGFVISLTIAVLYFVGWVAKNQKIALPIVKSSHISVLFVLVLVLLFGSGCLGYGASDMTSVNTALSLLKGETQQYHAEMMKRVEMYEDPTISDVIVNPISVYPDFCGGESLVEDPDYWTNRAVAKYYGKDSVKIDLSEEE